MKSTPCGGCSATVPLTETPCGDWGTCPTCGALIGENVTTAGYRATMSGQWAPDNFKGKARYFDIMLAGGARAGYRAHGWYDPCTGDLVQAG